jgi:23S rRNA pseudouridine1911/1915/1917 synthase
LAAIEPFERLLLEEEQVPLRRHSYDGDEEIEADGDEGEHCREQLFEDNSGQRIAVSVVVPPEMNGKRVDAVLAALLPDKPSRSSCGAMVDDGRVFCRAVQPDDHVSDEDDDDAEEEIAKRSTLSRQSERILRKSQKVRATQELIVVVDPDRGWGHQEGVTPQDVPIDILYEDEDMIVVNKRSNVVVHPGAGNWDGTIVNGLAYYYLANNSTSGTGDFVVGGQRDALLQYKQPDAVLSSPSVARPGIVHRLDKGTTGVLVVAKTVASLTALSDAFARRRVRKTYLAVCVGDPTAGITDRMVTIDKPIGRHPVHRQRMRVVPQVHRESGTGNHPNRHAGRRAVSIVNTIAYDGKLSLVRVRILTGRTHQIRVHLQDRRAPVCGDDVYGSADWNRRIARSHGISRPLLHAYRLELSHPTTGEPMCFTAPVPDDLLRIASIVYPQGKGERPDIFGEHR